MILTPLLLAPLTLAAVPPTATRDLLAIRAPRVEVGNGETLHRAVILVEDGKIVMIGEDLEIERGIPVLVLEDDQVVIPGLVNAYSRLGMSGGGYSDARPYIMASDELNPGNSAYKSLREAGVTTLGHYPAGSGIPGQGVAVRTAGATAEEMILKQSCYLKIIAETNRTAKARISDGFKKGDTWIEKEAKNKEKWDKEKEKFDKEKDEEKKQKLDPGPYAPLERDQDAQAFLDLRAGDLKALISIRAASDYLHLIDAIGEEEFSWDLRVVMTRNLDVFHISDKIGEAGLRVIIEPELSLHPNTMRQRNMPAELVRAGAKLVLVPRGDSTTDHKNWRRHVGEIVAAGLDFQTALTGMTLEAAALLGVDDQVGSLEAGKAANLLILGGEPFETTTEIDAVMLDGKFVHGEVDL
ncbi:MAG: amidohydrolase family protein [Planctomycetota bacterium]|nr:amidohydrolase family protein [Planctomycetota bacterium]